MPAVLNTIEAWRTARTGHRAAGRSVGFVPTMGALHEGHASLFRAARAENDVVLASVFVNPTQFDEAHDFERYPRTLPADLTLMQDAGVDGASCRASPTYPGGTRYRVEETRILARTLRRAPARAFLRHAHRRVETAPDRRRRARLFRRRTGSNSP